MLNDPSTERGAAFLDGMARHDLPAQVNLVRADTLTP